ncbi:MAG: methyl-accepting chemotaxis protein [Carboxydocellales bacterium]
MFNRVKGSLQLKLSLTIAVVLIVTMAVGTYITVKRETSNMTTEIEAKGRMITTAYAEYAKEVIQKDNYAEFREVIRRFAALDKDIKYVVIVDKTGYAPVHTNPAREKRVFNDPVGLKAATSTTPLAQIYPRDTGEIIYDMSAPITINGQHWGAVRIGIPIEVLQSVRTNAIIANIISTVVTLLIAIFGISLMLNSIIRPVKNLMNATETIAQGDFNTYVEVKTTDEVGRLAVAFNEMVSSVKKLLVEVMSTSNEIDQACGQIAVSTHNSSQAIDAVANAINEVSLGNNTQTERIGDIAATMEQFSKAINQVANDAMEQSDNVQLTTSTITQMAQNISNVANNTQAVSTSSVETSTKAKKGGETLQETIVGMERIKQTVFDSATKIKELGDQSQKIGEIVQVIDDIAGQTNLLALNAAIEAARAGEHGKGFAVVADEVRKLAERSGKATKEIANLIANIQKGTEQAVLAMKVGTEEVEKGSELAKGAGTAFDDILKSIEQSVVQVSRIATAAEEMRTSSQEVVTAINNVARSTEVISAATEQMSASSTEVNNSVQNIAAISEQTAAAAGEVNVSVSGIMSSTQEIDQSVNNLTKINHGLKLTMDKFKV